MKRGLISVAQVVGTLLLALVCQWASAVDTRAEQLHGVATDSAHFNDMLGKQIKPGTLSVEEQPDGSFLLTNKLQTVSAHVSHKGVTFDSIGNSAGKGGFSLKLDRWGRDHSLHKVTSATLYKQDESVYHNYNNGLAEKFRNTSGGIQQDFIVAMKPQGRGDLHIRLQVSDASVKQKDNGAIIALNSGRQLTYDRLAVTDAAGKTVPAEIRVTSNNLLDVIVHDADAQYPLVVDPTVGDQNWVSMGTLPGAGGYVQAILVNGSDIYFAGNFTFFGNVLANNIVKWNGSNWSALGSGLSKGTTNDCFWGWCYKNIFLPGSTSTNGAYALAMDAAGNLYAGGWFHDAGGVANTQNIARWDGTQWNSLGAAWISPVFALAIDNTGKLYVAHSSFVSTLVGTTWVNIGSLVGACYGFGGPCTGAVYEMVFDNSGNLFVGGAFIDMNNIPANNVAKWNGSSWSAIGSGVPGEVYALTIDNNGTLYAGGYNFISACGYSRCYSSTFNGAVFALSVDNYNNLYAAGSFTSIGGITANNIAKRNTAGRWSSLGAGVSGNFQGSVIYSLAQDGSGNVYAGGYFRIAGSIAATNVAQWNGNAWNSLGVGNFTISDDASSLAVGKDGILYAGGLFVTAGNAIVNNIAQWDGSNWNALGSGLVLDSQCTKNGRSCGNYIQLVTDPAGNLYVSGPFTSAGGVANTNYIAKWDGSNWSALGTGLNKTATALTIDPSGNLYAAGLFTSAGGMPANGIAKWDGNMWSVLGSGLNAPAYTLGADTSGNLYAAGQFTNAGGVPANYIAKWNGSNWSALGSGLNATAYALGVDTSGRVYVTGSFGTAGGITVNHIAMWNGNTWSALGTGLLGNGAGLIMDQHGGLYVSGQFTKAGGIPANYIARWDGTTWSALGSGLDTNVYWNVLAMDGYGGLYVGGDLFLKAGGKVSPYLAKWLLDTDEDGVPDNQDCYPYDSTQSTCLPGTYPTGTGFVLAPAGSYAINGVLAKCPLGSYQPAAGSSSCILAPPGTYVDTTGSVSYSTCPTGDSSYAGAVSAAQCFADADGDGLPDAIDTNSDGVAKGDHTGVAVALADMDGDGYADILIGSPYADRVYVVGSRTFTQKDVGSIRIISGTTGAVINTLYGFVTKQHFGTAFAVVPDQDGDGIPDIVVGNPLAPVFVNHMAFARAGNISLYSGASGALIRLIANGTTAGEQFGSSVAAGDVNNDGTLDLIVGSPRANVTGATKLSKAGKVTVLNGLSNSVLYIRTGLQAGEHFGAAVAFNSLDKQLLVGSPGYDDTYVSAGKTVKHNDAGRVQIFDATDLTGTSAVLFTRSGDNKGDHFGASISSFSQDITGDAQTDWMVGIPGADILNNTTGKTMKDAGKVQLFSGFNSVPVTEITGANAGDNEGAAVSATGDINKDGINDLAIGANKYDVSTSVAGKTVLLKDAGRVEVINGSSL